MEVVEIEATNKCNTRCLHCPHESITRPMGMMTWETFQATADQVLAMGRTKAVSFAGMGEPTLNVNLPRFIEYFKGKIFTFITTNAAALTSRNIEKLIEAGLGTMTISFNGTDAATYELMMGGLNFERAEKNLREAVRQAKGRMKVAANVSITKQTMPRLTHLKAYLEDAGVDEIFFSQCHTRGGHLMSDFICNTPMPPANSKRCDIFDNTLFVAWNGDVLACCHDLDGVGKLGNLTTDTLKDIDAYKHRLLGKGAIFKMCDKCNDLPRFGNDAMPDKASLYDWVLDLYTTKGDAPARVVEQLREKEAALNAAEQRIDQLQNLVDGYERGKFIRLMKFVKGKK